MKSAGGGEIIQVQGGHIVRSVGRKDRHSKVFTAKGPRDRRVRLSAHTAIQFYDVQDRLGYDRPSKAVDWLMKKAKSSIEKLDELPPWDPTTLTNSANVPAAAAGSQDMASVSEDPPFPTPPPQSFFPTSSSTVTFPVYPPANPNEDLCLSLHSFQDPTGTIGFESNFHRIEHWNGENNGLNMNKNGFLFNPPPFEQQLLLGQGSVFSQRGPLQSSFSPEVRTWGDIPVASSRFPVDGFPGFCIPARINRDDDKPSSDSRGS